MLWLMRSGGVPGWYVLLFGLIALGAAVLFAWRPDPKRLPAIKALSIATVASVVAGVASDLAATGWKVSHNPDWGMSPEVHLYVLTGFAESMAPAILGGTLLSLVWLLVAVGHRRLGRQL